MIHRRPVAGARRALAVFAFALVAIAPFARAQSQAPEAVPPYSVLENVVYVPDLHGAAMAMDVFRPTAASNGRGIVLVVSGAWHSDLGKLRDLKRAGIADVFCERGYTLFAARPGSIDRFTGTEMLNSVKRAIRWAKHHAEEFGIDPEKIGISGASAGGHLSSLAALTADEGNPEAKDPIDRHSSRVAAAGVFFPPTDFKAWMNGAMARMPGLKGLFFEPGDNAKRTPEEIDPVLISLSPARQVNEGAPPFLIFHGDADPLVPLEQSEILLAALKEKGIEAELVVKPGGGHPWPTIREEVVKLADWFDARLK